MYDLISIGTLTVDLFFKGDSLSSNGNRFELAMGGKYFTNHFYEGLGGGATNVAIGVQKHGLRTSLKTVIGENSFRKTIIDKLEETGVSYLHSQFEKEHLNISCILLSGTGEKTVINYQTPHQHLFKSVTEYESLLRAHTIYFANAPDIAYTNKLKILRYAKQHDRCVIMNMGVVDCRRTELQLMEMLSYVDVLIVNGYEFSDIVKRPYHNIHFKHAEAISYFPKKFSMNKKIVIVTDGPKGSYGYYDGKYHYQVGLHPSTIVDSTGAGDGYSAGFISEYIKTHSIEKAMKEGAEYAYKILNKVGANEG